MMKWFQDHHIWTKLLAFTLAIVLWAIVIRGENPQRTLDVGNVPVQLIGEGQIRTASGLVVTGVSSSQINVKLRGTFLRLGQIESDDIIVRADVSKFTVPGMFYVDYDVSTPIGVTYEGSSPSKLQITFDKIVEKELDVVVEYEGEAQDGITVEKAAVSPSTIVVYGTSEMMANADRAVVKINRSELTEDFEGEMPYYIADTDGKKLESPYTSSLTHMVYVSVPVYMTKTVQLTAVKKGNKLITEDQIDITVRPESVEVYGKVSVLKNIKEIKVGTMDVSNFTISSTNKFPVVLPEGVEFSGNPIETCEVSAVINGITSNQITITDFEFLNMPEDAEVNMQTVSVTISIRGLKDAMRGISAGDFKATVDLSSVEPSDNAQILPITLTCLKEGVEICGTKYSVVVSVTS